MTTDSGTGGDGGAAAVTTDPDWRARAAEAERRITEMEAQLAAAARDTERARAALDAAERRRQIDRELTASETVDLETAALLTEAAVAAMSAPDVAAAVADLRRRKPFLFRTPHRAGAMSGAVRSHADPLGDAATEARATGDRAALLRYLRMKRAR
ncbi:MAG: hypothetical protein IT437_08240 [Phycisphaerales bacterium]|nr:hypothetical protein [Phycisphaerales bacterium]